MKEYLKQLALEDTNIIIPENELEFILRRSHSYKVFESDSTENIINKQKKFYQRMKIKIMKNKFIILILGFSLLIYCFVLFETLLPLFETLYSVHSLNYFYNNKFMIYTIIFNILFFLFIISLIRSATMDPGYIEDDYSEIYSLKKYYDIYKSYFQTLIFKRKEKFNDDKEYPNIVTSNVILREKNNQLYEETDFFQDDESIIVDPDENIISLNYKLKELEKIISEFRKNIRYKHLWSLNCFNFHHKNIKDNICRYCIVIKSERVNHCRSCKKCIKRMDHHCFFLNCCIGLYNYKIFINMLCYCTLLICFICYMMIETLKYHFDTYPCCLYTLVYIMIILILIIIGSFVFYFLIYHFILIFKGITQLEYMFGIYEREDEYFSYLKYHNGWKKFTSIFGTNPINWFLPIKPSFYNNGYIFRYL